MALPLPSLLPDLQTLRLGTWDVVGLVLLAACTVGYHGLYGLWTSRHPLDTVKGKTALYRRTWVKRIVDRDEQMLAVQSLRNLLMTSQIMASSALVVVAVVLNYMLAQASGDSVPDSALSLKLLILVGMYGYAFFSFLLSTRHYNHFTILIGADHDLITSVEPVDAITFLTNILNRAGNRFTMGQRAFYFSLPVIAWIVDARAFVGLTLMVFVYLAAFLDLKKWKPPFPLRARVPDDFERGGPGTAAAPLPPPLPAPPQPAHAARPLTPPLPPPAGDAGPGSPPNRPFERGERRGPT